MSKSNRHYTRGDNLVLVALLAFPTHIQISLNVAPLYNNENVYSARIYYIFLTWYVRFS